jgi:branched-chain amino acid transport system substrate-binding protein
MNITWKFKLVAAAAALAVTAGAQAQQEIRIGVIYPLTGSLASSGAEMRDALEFAADIVNNGLKGVPELPFSAGGGLSGLKGAKIKLVFADHQGNPQVGASEAERLITQEHVVALMGAYNSNVTQTASQVAERDKIPFLNAESSSPTLTQRHFKYFFRTTPDDALFVRNAFDFMKDIEQTRHIKIGSVATLAENTLFGDQAAKLQQQYAAAQGFNMVKQVSYPAKTTQLTSEVQTLKAANPTVLLQSSYSEAILSMKTYKELGYLPDMLIANDAGFADTEFIKTLGKDAEYVISREVWALDIGDKKPIINKVDDLFKARYKIDFTGNSARSFTGLLVLADAINRAGSTDPEAIRKALIATNIPSSALIMPWKGVKFDETGQNTQGAGILVQVRDGKYSTVWPFDLASKDVVWPMPKWDARK